ncbi:MAG: PhnD/SsuA/transferrin family substrate-binding protein [Bdellovibrionales bacterium]|nr:PhnD/SsuA/transferrin family substrate-binding protein [Bdellovibrionales bacterium]MBT3525452.1 PhnD/SsuA/transferrin family substrate-binding protein [Bdellovibrionales bacterium]MBT7670553.1 PhnD/SsuA/transferrin family substrate-binding protein [Bdellovibrionales bacterium]
MLVSNLRSLNLFINPLLLAISYLILIFSPCWILHAETGKANHSLKRLTLVLPPVKSYREIIFAYNPWVNHLRRELQIEVEVVVAPSSLDLVTFLGRGDADIALLDSELYFRLRSRSPAAPVIAQMEFNGILKQQGVIVVKKGGPIKNLKELKGRTFAFGPFGSMLGDTLPCQILKKALPAGKRSLARYHFFTGQDDVAINVLSGGVDAGAMRSLPPRHFADSGLRILHYSPHVSTPLLVGRAGLPAALIKQLQSVLLGLKKTTYGNLIMTAITPELTGFQLVNDKQLVKNRLQYKWDSCH